MREKTWLDSLKVGDAVIFHLFSGAVLGLKVIEEVTDTTVKVTVKGELATFSKENGVQIDPVPKRAIFSNYISEYTGDNYVRAKRQRGVKKSYTSDRRKVEPPEPDFNERDYPEGKWED